MIQFDFSAAPTLLPFVRGGNSELNDEARHETVMGPLGSGKTFACCARILWHAMNQAEGPDGVRRSRWAVVRNYMSELRSTTAKTWESTVPVPVWGDGIKWGRKPAKHMVRIPDNDGVIRIELDVEFLALDDEQDVKRLMSLEVTGAYFNELQYVRESIFNMMLMRVGRYPPKIMGGPSWFGIISDTNAWEEGHWLDRYLPSDDREAMPGLLRQPPAVIPCAAGDPEALRTRGNRTFKLNPKAENLANLPGGDKYYRTAVTRNSDEWVARFLACEQVFLQEGIPVIKAFRQNFHVCKCEFDPKLRIIAGIDCGSGSLNPAAVFLQRTESGVWRVLGEVVGDKVGLEPFAATVRAKVHEITKGIASISVAWCDPSAKTQMEVGGTAALFLSSKGIPSVPVQTNDLGIRILAIQGPCERIIQGEPGFQVDPNGCPILTRALAGGWFQKKVRTAGQEELFKLEPVKNMYSHPADALSYGLIGGGEGDILRGAPVQEHVLGVRHDPNNTSVLDNIFGRQGF